MHKKNLNKFTVKPLLFGLFGFSFSLSTCVSADPLTLSSVPLQATGKVEPNLMILIDSSGSMKREVDSENDAATDAESRLGIAKDAAKTVVRGLGDLRVGLAQFNGSHGATLLKGLTSISDTGARDDLLTKIEAIEADGYTPLGEAMAELGRYFVEGYHGNDVTIHPGVTGEDTIKASDILALEPNYGSVSKPTSASPAIQQYCQKNFILALTDGIPTHDDPSSTYISNYDGDANTDNNDVLDDVAKALYDIDWRPDLTNPNDASHKNNIVSHYIGFADPALANNQLLTDAGANGGGSYSYADSAASLLTSLNDAVNSISNSVGTQASVAFNSTSLDIGSVIYSAKFDTSDFSGRLYARSLNPDTGRIATTLWEASEKLADESSASRAIITSMDGTGVPFTATNSGVDDNPTDSAHEDDLNFNDSTGAADGAWASRLDYLRGNTTNDGSGNYRQRGAFSALVDKLTGPKLLGDIVHSTPIYVGKPELNWPSSFGGNNAADSYDQFVIDNASRTPMVYVGANDGMLHGFNANTGEEVFAYVPELVLDTTRYKGLHSFTDSNYPHNYYVDLTPTVSDIYINAVGNNQDEWVSVLVGGLRGGGKGYFALNVSDPTRLSETNADEIAMWEFDGATDAANLGYSYSEAQIAKLNNDKWAVIFGNGYNSDNGVAGLFVVYIEEGLNGWSTGDWKFISTGVGADGTGRKNGLSSPRLIDLNGDRVVDRVYAGDMMGNMWSFDLSANSDSSWGIYGGKPLFAAPTADVGKPHRAIMAAPLVARNIAVSGSGANVLVMFGTGQYLNGSDLTDNAAGAFYAVWDNDHTVSNASITDTDLAERQLDSGTYGRVIDTDNTDTLDWTTHHGWKMVLDTGSVDATGYAGERVISSPTLRRNTLFFSTVSPNPQPCASSGSGYLMSLDFRTGLAGDDAVADFNKDGEIDAQDEGYVGIKFEQCTGDNCDEGGGSGGDPGMPGQSGFIGDVRCTPGSSGDVICDDIDVGDEEREGRLSWEEFSPR
ncbi:type IV pilus assembly protein PilY1 [Microbulbifer donghaiensis]|uniref:Type IV pilus assembly protein PilY1 n=1 Tax=Microbulbifer donghaiensis TaxID=494016 RepID=A0A1M5HWJ9_9GAMM|nr:PilC/PilY family type IV pilus protein [Microbulbifer donghaiensis]SHG20341.1 type IV pilus assembly protein PilY1 [Microbulbifer donghaiensis]